MDRIDPPKALNGVLDLSEWDFNKQGVVKLDGEWEFYWNRLLSPEDFNHPEQAQKTGYINVPAVWNGYAVDGNKLDGNGYATHRLIIRTRPSSMTFAVKGHIIPTAYNLWVNGEKLLSNGKVGTSRDSMEPFWLPDMASFRPNGKTLEVVVQVSNYMHRRGGLRQSIMMGTEDQIQKKRETSLLLEHMLIGGLIMMGLYHFGLFAFRRNDRSALYFGIICTITAIRVATTGNHLLNVYSDISWEHTLKLEYLSFYGGIPFFVLFLRSLYPEEMSGMFIRITIILGVIFSLLVLFSDASIYTHSVTLYQIIAIFYIFYSLAMLMKAAYRKKQGARLFLIGWAILIGTVINDILYSQMVIFTGHVAPFGFFVFIFSQSYLLSVRFSNAFLLAEKLSKENKEMVLHLEKKVEERTQRLENAYQTIKKISVEDALTDSYNRRYLDEQLPKEAIRASRYNHMFSVILCDIDFFKKVNDNYGHQTGDQVLVEFVEVIKSVIRQPVDWVTRYGGEEFLIALPGTDLESATILAERMRQVIENHTIMISDRQIKITSSFGVSQFQSVKGEADLDIDAMLKAADDRLYKAKKQGRNQVVYR